MPNRSYFRNPRVSLLGGVPRAALLLFAWLAWSSSAAAQEAADDKPAKLFSSESALEVTITAPWGDVEK